MDEDERAIRELIHAWMAASKAGDTAAVLDMMTDDVIFMTPGREPFGKAEFEATSKGMCNYRIDGRAEVRELKVLGDWAWIRNWLQLEITPPDGESSRRSGYTLTVLRKGEDGRWRLCRDANLVS